MHLKPSRSPPFIRTALVCASCGVASVSRLTNGADSSAQDTELKADCGAYAVGSPSYGVPKSALRLMRPAVVLISSGCLVHYRLRSFA